MRVKETRMINIILALAALLLAVLCVVSVGS